MDRRQMLRLSASGLLVAALAPLSGCSSALPPEAIAAWQPPPDDLELRRWVLAHAVLAPHSHNLQSWLIDLGTPDTILLYMDSTRLLPETDPFSRQMVMSQGTFLEVLSIAARQRGYRALIEPFPEGPFDQDRIDERPTARITLVREPAIEPDPLFAQVFMRRTNRLPYEPRVPDAAAIAAIRSSVAGFPARVGFAAGMESSIADHRRIACEAFRIEMITPRTLLESYKVLRVGPREIAEHRDGLSINDPFVRLLTVVGLFDRTQPSAPGSRAILGQIEDFNATIAATSAFFWLVTDDNQRATQLEAGRAYVRAQLAATAQGLSMHPLSQALQEYSEQEPLYREIHRLLQAEGAGQTVQMWARLGYGPPLAPAPRRGLAAHLRAS